MEEYAQSRTEPSFSSMLKKLGTLKNKVNAALGVDFAPIGNYLGLARVVHVAFSLIGSLIPMQPHSKKACAGFCSFFSDPVSCPCEFFWKNKHLGGAREPFSLAGAEVLEP